MAKIRQLHPLLYKDFTERMLKDFDKSPKPLDELSRKQKRVLSFISEGGYQSLDIRASSNFQDVYKSFATADQRPQGGGTQRKLRDLESQTAQSTSERMSQR